MLLKNTLFLINTELLLKNQTQSEYGLMHLKADAVTLRLKAFKYFYIILKQINMKGESAVSREAHVEPNTAASAEKTSKPMSFDTFFLVES